MKWSEVLLVINNIIFVIFRVLTRALMITPLVIFVFLWTNTAYNSVIGRHGIFNSGAMAMVSIIHNNAQKTHCSL